MEETYLRTWWPMEIHKKKRFWQIPSVIHCHQKCIAHGVKSRAPAFGCCYEKNFEDYGFGVTFTFVNKLDIFIGCPPLGYPGSLPSPNKIDPQ